MPVGSQKLLKNGRDGRLPGRPYPPVPEMDKEETDRQTSGGIVLAGFELPVPPKSPLDDALLVASEVPSLDLRGTQLANLSACETGLGRITNGDGVYGLRRGFALAGARALSLSTISESTSRISTCAIGLQCRSASGAREIDHAIARFARTSVSQGAENSSASDANGAVGHCCRVTQIAVGIPASDAVQRGYAYNRVRAAIAADTNRGWAAIGVSTTEKDCASAIGCEIQAPAAANHALEGEGGCTVAVVAKV